MGVEAVEEGAGTHHVIAHFGITDGTDTVVDALQGEGQATGLAAVDEILEFLPLVIVLLAGFQSQVREDTHDVQIGQSKDLLDDVHALLGGSKAQTMHTGVHLDLDLGLLFGGGVLGQDLGLAQRAAGLGDVVVHTVLQQVIGGQTQHQDLAVLVEAAQLHSFVQGGHAEVADAVLHHVLHHNHSAMAVAVGLDDGHGLYIGTDLLTAAVDVILQIVQIDLRTGRTQMFHRYNSFFYLKIKIKPFRLFIIPYFSKERKRIREKS